MKKYFLALGTVLLLGAGCTSSFPWFTLSSAPASPASPTSTEATPETVSDVPATPSGWQAYENVIHGFAFSYPPRAMWNMGSYALEQTVASFDLGTLVTSTSAASIPTTELAVRTIPSDDARIKDCFFSESRWPEDANIETSKLTVGGRDVCLAMEQDAGAGNYYSSYAYSIKHGGEFIVFNFVVHSVNCQNYDDPEAQCVAFDEARDTKDFQDIVGTIGFTSLAKGPFIDMTLFKEMTKTDKTKGREITLSYPHLDGYADAAAQTEFNRVVDERVQKSVDQFKSDFGDAGSEAVDTASGPWTLFLDTYTYPAPGGRVSVVFQWSEYTGGAHPNTFYETLVFNATTKKAEALAELFAPGVDYAQVLSEKSVAELKRRNSLMEFSDDDWINDGAGPSSDNFAATYLSDAGVTVIFDPYQVAAYAAGPSEVLIPYAALQGKLAL